MMEKSKVRAPRNKTLTISDDEVIQLDSSIYSADEITEALSRDVAIINSNLMECLDSIPDAIFDLIIVDPPYNLSKNFNGSRFASMSSEHYYDYLKGWFGKVCDKLKPTGSLYMCGDWKSTADMQRIISSRLTILNRITWQRDKGRGAAANWKNSMEDIWFAVNDPHNYYFNVDAVRMKRRVLAPYREAGKPKDWEQSDAGKFRLTNPSNFWDDISIPFWSMHENTDHPTQKPEKLLAKLILASSAEGDYIFDPFLGSGSTAVVAKKLNRKCVGVEINREYCRWGAKRVMRAVEDKSIQGYTDGVFWERNSLPMQRKKSIED